MSEERRGNRCRKPKGLLHPLDGRRDLGIICALRGCCQRPLYFLHRELWSKAFSDLKSSGADPLASQASCVGAFGQLVGGRPQDGKSRGEEVYTTVSRLRRSVIGE
jgi:hypothetical protein